MTLAKKHYQRLWFPEPGHGGAIPSRSEHALTMQDFHNAFPEEFWREVVDRVAREVPDTLLLAEAFWLMESYFVRTLGMHRVYNSAFMNMLRNEDNAKYRALMKNTLEFDPEILKRFVNFMNNPDERTAVDQFGKGDKYFGICTLMVTLPGLPMFGHGQIEGYSEKYGMEYRRAYLNEQPDFGLIARHEREIFPITHQRYLFSGVENFCLYDFYTENGVVDEDVYAYSNGVNGQRALVVFHNKYASTQGWIRVSAANLNKKANPPKLEQRSLGDGLALHHSDHHYGIFHDIVSGMDTLLRCDEIFNKGMFFHLDAYSCRVFNSIQEVEDTDGTWAELYGEIGGRPVHDVFRLIRLLRFRDLHHYTRELFRYRLEAKPKGKKQLPEKEGQAEDGANLLPLISNFLNSFCNTAGITHERVPETTRILLKSIEVLKGLLDDKAPVPFIHSIIWQTQRKFIKPHQKDPIRVKSFFIWTCLHALHHLVPGGTPETTRAWMDEYALIEPIQNVLREAGAIDDQVYLLTDFILSAVRHQDGFQQSEYKPYAYLSSLFSEDEARHLLGVNYSGDILWFRKETLESWLDWAQLINCIQAVTKTTLTWSEKLENFIRGNRALLFIRKLVPKSEFKVEKLLELAETYREA